MDAKKIFKQIQQLVKDGNLDKAKTFLEENKDSLGKYYDQAKKLIAGNQGVNSLMDKVKKLFGGKF